MYLGLLPKFSCSRDLIMLLMMKSIVKIFLFQMCTLD